jgi:hypothetical protein
MLMIRGYGEKVSIRATRRARSPERVIRVSIELGIMFVHVLDRTCAPTAI